MLLAQWNYTKEEWKNFQHWRQRERGLICYFFYWLNPLKAVKCPEVRIAADRVWTNNLHEPFQNSTRQFRDIQIRKAGNVNILEIYFELKNRICDIIIPIPKGKLREAIEVQERLLLDNVSVG